MFSGDFSSSNSEVRRRGGQIRGQNTFGTSISPSPSVSSFEFGGGETFGEKMASNCGRDRTSEFATTVRSLRGRNFAPQPQMPNRSQVNQLLTQQSQEFMKIAAGIGRDIAKTYTKLEKLTLLAKRRTLFDDRPAEIQELIGIIKEDTNALNRQIDQLSRISKNQRANLKSKHQATHSSTVVAALQLRLASMTSDFKSVLEVRSENLRESKSRREQFSQGAVTRSMPQSAMNGFPSGSVLVSTALEDDEAQANGQVLNMHRTWRTLRRVFATSYRDKPL